MKVQATQHQGDCRVGDKACDRNISGCRGSKWNRAPSQERTRLCRSQGSAQCLFPADIILYLAREAMEGHCVSIDDYNIAFARLWCRRSVSYLLYVAFYDRIYVHVLHLIL